MTDIRMYRISKIHWCRSERQLKYITFWRKDKQCRKCDFFAEKRSLTQEDIHGHLYHIFLSLMSLHRITKYFVQNMIGSPLFSIYIHLFGANLYLNRLTISFKTQYSRMQALISVWFWYCNKVFEPISNRCIFSMNDSQHCITIAHIIDDDTESKYIIDFSYTFCTVLSQFAIDRIHTFYPI